MTTDQGNMFRPEAQAFKFKDLKESQREAVRDIIKKLLDGLNISVEKTKDKEKPLWTIPVPENSVNKVILLTGGRGSGKTSVLYSLIKMLENHENLKEILDNEKYPNLLENCEKINKRLIWLDPLEMEILPTSTNLLAAILSRVDEAIARFRGEHPETRQDLPNPYYFSQTEQDVLLKFTKLQQDAALAWNGNLEQRSPNLDTDLYAVEVLRAEHNRINLNRRIGDCLDDLQRTYIKRYHSQDDSLFVLPVDDFDINPQRCVELMRLIRMLNVPRLLVLILGDIKIISHLMNLKVIESIASVNNNQSFSLADVQYDESRLSHELSDNILRKLFALPNQVSLKPMEHEEVLSFLPPDRKDSKKEKIQDFLENYKEITLNTARYDKNKSPWIANKEIENLFNLFDINVSQLVDWQYLDEKPDSEYFYIRKNIFRMYPRHVQDLWLQFKDAYEKRDRSNKLDYLNFARKLYKARIREGQTLTLRLSKFLENILEKDFKGNLQLDTSSLSIDYTYSQPIILNNPNTNEKNKTATKTVGAKRTPPEKEGEYLNAYEPFVGILHPRGWGIKVVYPKSRGEVLDIPGEIELNNAAAAGIVLVHDLLAFKHPNNITGKKLMLGGETPLWAYTQWPYGNNFQSIKVPWYFPPWLTMFECDLLRRSWVQVWEWLSYLKGKDPNRIKEAKEFLFYAWLRVITTILSPETLNDEDAKLKLILPDQLTSENLKNKIEGLIRDVESLVQEDGKRQYEHRQFIIRGFFAAMGCLLAPETAMPEETIYKALINNKKVIEKRFSDSIISSGIRKLRAKSAVRFFDSGAIELLVKLFNPQVKSGDKVKGYDFKKEYPFNKETCRCPFIEDIISLSKLTYSTREKYTSALMALIKG